MKAFPYNQIRLE